MSEQTLEQQLTQAVQQSVLKMVRDGGLVLPGYAAPSPHGGRPMTLRECMEAEEQPARASKVGAPPTRYELLDQPADMSPAEDGEWVRWADVSHLWSEVAASPPQPSRQPPSATGAHP